MAKPNRDQMPYRDCAGVVVFNRRGKVFIGHRQDTPGDSGWQLPQGGVDDNEEPVDAALRELYEETSMQTVSLLTAAPDWIFYDLPDDLLGKALKGRYRGQRQKWFAVLFEGDDAEIDVLHPGGGSHPVEFDDWRWEDLGRLPELIVPFKRDAYEQIVAAFHDVPQKLADA